MTIDEALIEVNLPTRTHNTDLSDDALLLLDAIIYFNGWVADQMSQEDYSFHMNVGYSHSLADKEILHTLEDLRKIGVLRKAEQEFDISWFATEMGGCFWESERQPIWGKFVVEWHYYAPPYARYDDPIAHLLLEATDDNPIAVIRSPSQETLRSYYAATEVLDMWKPKVGSEVNIVCSMDFGWKVFERMHVLCVPILSYSERNESMAATIARAEDYNRRRTWWRNLQELQTLREDRG